MLFVILFIVMFLRVAGLYLIVFLPRLSKVFVGARMHEFFKDLKSNYWDSYLISIYEAYLFSSSSSRTNSEGFLVSLYLIAPALMDLLGLFYAVMTLRCPPAAA
jgi:hypothetical protein